MAQSQVFTSFVTCPVLSTTWWCLAGTTPPPAQKLSLGPKSTRIHNVYDKDIRETLTWESSCQFGRGGSGCIPGEAWLGLYTRGLQPDIKCFKIFQPRGGMGISCEALPQFDGDSWWLTATISYYGQRFLDDSYGVDPQHTSLLLLHLAGVEAQGA